jgi:hypothetical protein
MKRPAMRNQISASAQIAPNGMALRAVILVASLALVGSGLDQTASRGSELRPTPPPGDRKTQSVLAAFEDPLRANEHKQNRRES